MGNVQNKKKWWFIFFLPWKELKIITAISHVIDTILKGIKKISFLNNSTFSTKYSYKEDEKE